jgi:hypothetical protein
MMQQALNIVELIETNPITRLNETYNVKLLDKIKTNFTEYEQQLFLTSFYCYLNYNKKTDFVIDLDNIWEWVGFSQKINAKRLLDKHFTLDKDYKILLNHQVKTTELLLCHQTKQSDDTRGGHNKEIIMLNIETFKKFCMKAGTKKADEIHEYYLKLEEIIQESLEEQNTELQRQLENVKEEKEKLNEELETIKSNKTTLYIYNMDIRVIPCELKIGVTLNLHQRLKNFKQTHKFDNLEFSISLEDINVKNLEHYIHSLLKSYRIEGEVFRIDVEEAKCVMMGVVNRTKFIQINNTSERQLKLRKLFEQEMSILNNEPIKKISTNEIACQTDFDDQVPLSYPMITTNVDLYKRFDTYIEECCLIGQTLEVSSDDIIGQFRLWNRKVSNELKIAISDYLRRRFKHIRLKKQDKNQVQYGFQGVMVKQVDYKPSILITEVETFVYEKCKFSPSGKIFVRTLIDEYKEWKRNTSRTINGKDEKELRQYLNSHQHILPAVIWKPYEKKINEDGSNNTTENHTMSNDGYYGISLKSEDDKHYKNTSNNGKKVEKRDSHTDTVLETYETIAKAKEETKISTMSYAIKTKRIINNEYYFCLAKN